MKYLYKWDLRFPTQPHQSAYVKGPGDRASSIQHPLLLDCGKVCGKFVSLIATGPFSVRKITESQNETELFLNNLRCDDLCLTLLNTNADHCRTQWIYCSTALLLWPLPIKQQADWVNVAYLFWHGLWFKCCVYWYAQCVFANTSVPLFHALIWIPLLHSGTVWIRQRILTIFTVCSRLRAAISCLTGPILFVMMFCK